MRMALVLLPPLLLCGQPALAASSASRDHPCWQEGTTAAIAQCFATAQGRSDAALNHLYSQIMSVLDEGDQERLRKVQRLWIAYRDASCDAEHSLWEGGSGGNPAWLACLEDETRHRLDILQTTYRLRLQRLAPQP